MATYRYIVTVELAPSSVLTSEDIAAEIDSNLESVITTHDINDFTVESLSQVYEPAFVTAPLSPDGRYQS